MAAESQNFRQCDYGQVAFCRQPEVCKNVLKALDKSQFFLNKNCYQIFNYFNAPPTTSEGSSLSLIPQYNPQKQRLTGNSPPYRTLSHFGFNSPQQLPRAEHKHLPLLTIAPGKFVNYKPMPRFLSYEDIFATPRYEQLCCFCFEHLLRVKPEQSRDKIRWVTYSDHNYYDEKHIEKFDVNMMQPTPIIKIPPELITESDEQVKTQTGSGLLNYVNTFLTKLDGLNFSEDSENTKYLPSIQACSSDGSSLIDLASATGSWISVHQLSSVSTDAAIATEITEVLHFDNWLEKNDGQYKKKYDDATLRSQEPVNPKNFVTFEKVTAEEQKQPRQLMSRNERHRRKSEFHELWQEHVQYFSTAMQDEFGEQAVDDLQSTYPSVKISIEEMEHTYKHDAMDINPLHKPENPVSFNIDFQNITTEELPHILQQFEFSLNTAGKNLEKLVKTTKRLQNINFKRIPHLSVYNKTQRDDLENHDLVIYANSKNKNKSASCLARAIGLNEMDKAIFSSRVIEPAQNLSHKSYLKQMEIFEIKTFGAPKNYKSVSMVQGYSFANKLIPVMGEEKEENVRFFTPLENEILKRIEINKFLEREEIFSKIYRSIRNKLAPSQLHSLVKEKTFKTCNYICNAPSELSVPHIGYWISQENNATSAMLERTISSTNLQSQRNSKQLAKLIPKRRNFILENIRNASKPRFPKYTSKDASLKMSVTSRFYEYSESNICTFQTKKLGSSARLWISLPTSTSDADNRFTLKRKLLSCSSSVKSPSSSTIKGHYIQSTTAKPPIITVQNSLSTIELDPEEKKEHTISGEATAPKDQTSVSNNFSCHEKWGPKFSCTHLKKTRWPESNRNYSGSLSKCTCWRTEADPSDSSNKKQKKNFLGLAELNYTSYYQQELLIQESKLNPLKFYDEANVKICEICYGDVQFMSVKPINTSESINITNKLASGENFHNGDHSEAHLSTFSQSSKELQDISTDGSPKKDKKKKKGLRTPSFLKKKKEKKKTDV